MTSRRQRRNHTVTDGRRGTHVPGNLRGSIGNRAKCCLVVLLLRVSGDAMIEPTVSTVLRSQCDDAGGPGSGGRDGGGVGLDIRQCVQRPRLRPARQGRHRRRQNECRDADWGRAGRGCLHRRRHRSGQLRPPRRRRSARGARPQAPCHQHDRARSRPQHVPASRAPRSRLGHRAGDHRRRGHTAALEGVAHCGDRHRLRDARQQRDRHNPAGRRPGRDRLEPTAPCSTPTPCRPSARCR